MVLLLSNISDPSKIFMVKEYMYVGVIYISYVAFISVKQTMYFIKLAYLNKLSF